MNDGDDGVDQDWDGYEDYDSDDDEELIEIANVFNDEVGTKLFANTLSDLMNESFEITRGKVHQTNQRDALNVKRDAMIKQLENSLKEISTKYENTLTARIWKSTAVYVVACFYYYQRTAKVCWNHMNKTRKDAKLEELKMLEINSAEDNAIFAEYNQDTMIRVAEALQGKHKDKSW